MMLATLLLAVALQQPAAAPPAPQSPPAVDVGAVAPDFALPGATRFGTIKNPVHLSDFKGKTVVLAFFYKARTRG
ncbi:MAG: hypothetical protein ABR537_00815 [Gemmatimonadales bacterium]